jgi:PAS domain S-box-containing protein
MLTDITRRKEVEAKLKETLDNLENSVKERTAELEKAYNSLKESEKSLAEAQKMAHIGSWEWDIRADKAYWSDELYRIFGRDPQELAPPYNEYLNYVHPDDRDYMDSALKEALKGKTHSIEYRIFLANGEERAVNMQSEAIFDEKNVPIRMKGIIQDVTERKRAEENLQTLASIVESSHDAILTLSLDGIITSWNRGAEQIYGYSIEEILGKNASMLAPHNLKDEIKKLIDRIRQGIKIKNYETVRLKKDGTLINVSLTFSPIFDSLGKLTAISVIARDITERIKAEKSLAKAEDARKKEVHHRIKNNLQVISSLLDLQAEKFNDAKVVEAFRESQNRVISMALIHEELYKEEGTDTLNFSKYLKRLAGTLLQTYELSSKNIHLNTDLEENVFFDMDIAVPLGMVVNELISNSFKHAFTGRDRGEIRIKLGMEEYIESDIEGCESIGFTLEISDNGVGIPENLNIEELDSLGFQLVASLVEQLGGELEVKRNNGTEFTIKFTVTGKKQSGVRSSNIKE